MVILLLAFSAAGILLSRLLLADLPSPGALYERQGGLSSRILDRHGRLLYEIADPHVLKVRTTLNGEVMQDSSTSQLIFDVPTLIEFASHAFTLLPGDVIITGTPPGVGVFRDPPVFLRDGDTVTVEVEGIGQLTNPCVEE